MKKINLRDLSKEEMKCLIEELDMERYRLKQLWQWVMQKGVSDFSEMTNIPKSTREFLRDVSQLNSLKILDKQVSNDENTVKYLFELYDKTAIESVLMRHSYGRTACISTQVGCRMGCRFCASTLEGVVRNLSCGEMYEQVLTIQKDIGEKVTHVVLMGSGEPLVNYKSTVKFIRNIADKDALNISYRRITVSTCGLVPEIKKLADENIPVTLAVSLHAASDEKRNKLMPINRKYPLAELMQACREYALKTKRRITFEYLLVKNVNDSINDAIKLAKLLKGILCHVNLIPLNPVKENANFDRPNIERIKAFKNTLIKHSINATIRKEMGIGIDAACGQLKFKKLKGRS
ncbi:MAG: 23S rRNA (adenine(2503)-C(2))-methyltransferase RlmN [Desulfotomaculum sp.]|nr:23S rRNA (adenine(2503)-C(2))-methyltransferase RlmN [Desulfotomaculum sp.]